MFGFRFTKFQPTEYVFKYKNGKIVKEGAGISFFYYAPSTSIVVVPIGSVDTPFIFEEVTADFQTVTIQGQVTYRIVEQKKITNLLNYTLDQRGRGYASDDPSKLSQRIVNLLKVTVKKYMEDMDLKDAIRASERLAKGIIEEIRNHEEVAFLGLEILGMSILDIRPNSETARALEAQTREQILKMADDAIFERRNASIEQERKIKENELNTEIAVENKKKEIRETQIEAERAVQHKQHQLKDEQLNFEIKREEKKKELVTLSIENARAEADSKAYELSAVMKALEGTRPDIIQSLTNMGMKSDKLIAMAFQEIAEKAQKIGQLNISPDLLSELIKGNDRNDRK